MEKNKYRRGILLSHPFRHIYIYISSIPSHLKSRAFSVIRATIGCIESRPANWETRGKTGLGWSSLLLGASRGLDTCNRQEISFLGEFGEVKNVDQFFLDLYLFRCFGYFMPSMLSFVVAFS